MAMTGLTKRCRRVGAWVARPCLGSSGRSPARATVHRISSPDRANLVRRFDLIHKVAMPARVAAPAQVKPVATSLYKGRPQPSPRQFAAKQYIRPSPPVLLRSACEQPPSGPREGCEAFQDFEASSSRSPIRSACPSIAAPCVELVQFLQVRSASGPNAVPSACDPVSTSWRFGVSPRPLMTSPFSESAVCLVRLLLALWRSATSLAITTPLTFCHGPLPMRSLALTAGLPSAAWVER